jgi:hypothetical protein
MEQNTERADVQAYQLAKRLLMDKQVLYNGFNRLLEKLLEPGNINKQELVSIITDTLDKSHS